MRNKISVVLEIVSVCAFFCLWSIALYAQSGISIQMANGNEIEKKLAEKAAMQVEQFYGGLGIRVQSEKPVTLSFSNSIQIDQQSIDYALGIFDKRSNTIYLLHYNSVEYMQNAPFGLSNSTEFYYSIICHELAHFCNSLLSSSIEPIADEFVAATVQFSLLSEELRIQLVNHSSIPQITCPRDLTMNGYIADGSGFLIACYKLAQRYPHLLPKVINGTGLGIKDPFLVHKEY